MASLSNLNNIYGGNKVYGPTLPSSGGGVASLSNIFSSPGAKATPFSNLNQTLDNQAKPKPVSTSKPTPTKSPDFLQQVGNGISNAVKEVVKGITFTLVPPQKTATVKFTSGASQNPSATPSANLASPTASSSGITKAATPKVGKKLSLLDEAGNAIGGVVKAATPAVEGAAKFIGDQKVLPGGQSINSDVKTVQYVQGVMNKALHNFSPLGVQPPAPRKEYNSDAEYNAAVKSYNTSGVSRVNKDLGTAILNIVNGGTVGILDFLSSGKEKHSVVGVSTPEEGAIGTVSGAAGALTQVPLKTLLTFTGISMAFDSALKSTTGKDSVSGLLPKDSPQWEKTVVDGLEFLGKAIATHGLTKVSSNVLDTFTKNTITKYGLPETVQLTPEGVKNVIRGLDTGKNVEDLAKLDLTREQLKDAIKNGVNITLPTEKVVSITDKPLWGKIKSYLNIPATDSTTTTVSGGTKMTSFGGYLSEKAGENTPQEILDTVFKAGAENTPEGKAAIKIATEAQQSGHNIMIGQSGEELPQAGVETSVSQEGQSPTLPAEKPSSEATIKNGETPQESGGVDKQTAVISQNEEAAKLSTYFRESDNPIQKQNEDYLTNNLDTAQKDYLARVQKEYNTPHVISADDAKYILPGFEARQSSNYHSAASSFSKYMYDKQLAERAGQGNNTVMFLSGGTGAGKTTAIKDAQADLHNYSIIYDTNLSGKSAVSKIDKALAKGFNVEINYVQRHPINSFSEGVIPRIKNEGRMVSIAEHVDRHIGAFKTLEELKQKYGDRIKVRYIDNTGKAGEAKIVPFDNLPKYSYTKEELTNALYEETNKALQQNKITPEESSLLGQPSGQGSTSPSEKPQSESVQIGEPENYINPEAGSVSLNAGVNPGLDKLFSEDIAPAVKTAVDAGKQTYDVLNPPRASEAANKASNIIREGLAKIDNYSTLVNSKYNSYKKFFSRYSDEQNVKNISNFERTGTFAVEPKVKNGEMSYSQLYHDSMVESYKVIRSAYGKDETGFIENYVRRAFSFPNEEEQAKGTEALTNFSRSLSGSSSPLKQRVLDMPLDDALKDMQDRGIKVKMNSTNPEELRQWSLVNARKVLIYKQAWNDMKASQLVKFVANGAPLPPGMTRLNDRAAEVFAPAEVHFPAKSEGELSFQEKGYERPISMGRYYADPTVARILNNVISGGLEEVNLFKAARMMSNQLNSFQLGISAFHLTGTAINAGLSDMALGLRNLLQGKPLAATTKLARGLVPGLSFARDMYHGRQFMNDLLKDDPEAAAVLQKFINPAGARLARDNKYNDQMSDKLMKALANGNVIGAMLKIPSTIVETVAHPLLNYAIPRVKLGAYLDLASNVMDRLPKDATPNQVSTALARSWNSIDNRFGQLTYNNLFWNKTIKDIAMITTRSVGWNLGDVRELGGGMVVDPIQTMIRGKERVNNKFNERFSDRMLFSVSLILGVSIMGAIYQYLHTGEGPQELKDYFFPKDGGVDANGNPTRRSLPTYWKDIYAFSNDPTGTITNKSSPLISLISQFWTNKDYYGNLIRNPNDPVGTQLAQAGQYFLQNVLPFSIQSALQPGQSTGQKVEGFLGITKAPAAVVQSQQQKDVIQAYQNQVGLRGPQTPEQVATQKLKTQAYQEIKQNGYRNSPSFKKLVDNGTLNTRQKQILFIKNSQKTGIQRLGSHLPRATRRSLRLK